MMVTAARDRGEQTLTDPDVRDTWEIPEHLVGAEWNDAMLKVILATVQEELGVPNGTVLIAEPHSLWDEAHAGRPALAAAGCYRSGCSCRRLLG